MRVTTKRIATLAAISVLAAACGTGAGTTDTTGGVIITLPAEVDSTIGESTDITSGESSDTTAGESSDTTTAETGGSLSITESDLGAILTDADGVTLYLFQNDEKGGESTCYEDCAAAWPALEGALSAGAGVDAALIGTVARTDGTTQATYNGWPLYYYADDAGPGETNGQGKGGVWFVLDATAHSIEG